MQTGDNAIDPARWGVVIPSYNHAADAIACIRSLWDAEPRPGAVILVDDASPENAVGAVSEWAEKEQIPYRVVGVGTVERETASPQWLTIIAAEENGGFVRTANIGLRFVRDRTALSHVLLLNNDAVVAPQYFGELARAMKEHPDVGLLSGLILEWDRSTIWYAGASFNPLRALAIHDTASPQGTAPRDTGYVCGCTMLISRRALDTVGLLAECFEPCYAEDVDYSLRVRGAGLRVMFAPAAICYHRVGTSLGRERQSARTAFSVNRNRGFTLRRNYRGLPRALGIAYLAVTKPGRAVVELFLGRPGVAWAVLRGMLVGVLSPAAHKRFPGEGATGRGAATRTRRPRRAASQS